MSLLISFFLELKDRTHQSYGLVSEELFRTGVLLDKTVSDWITTKYSLLNWIPFCLRGGVERNR